MNDINIQLDDANFEDQVFSIDDIRDAGFDVPQSVTTVSNFIQHDVRQIIYPRCLPTLVKASKEFVKSITKYFNTNDITREDAKSILIREIQQILTEVKNALPIGGAAITLTGFGIGGLIGYLTGFTVIGVAVGTILGIIMGCIYGNQVQDFIMGTRNDLLIQAEKNLNIYGEDYNLDGLEEIYRIERPIFHPDRYRTPQQKRVFTKKYIKIEESYQIIRQLKRWN